MRKLSVMVAALLLVTLTGCAPGRNGTLYHHTVFDAKSSGGACSTTPEPYQFGYLAYDMRNPGDTPLIVTDIQPRDPENFRFGNPYYVGPKTNRLDYLNARLDPNTLPGFKELTTNLTIPPHNTYQFTTHVTVDYPAKDAYLRDFVVTYQQHGKTYEAATGFSYRLTHNTACPPA